MRYAIEAMTCPDLQQCMNVVGHDDPGDQPIVLRVKFQQRLLDEIGNGGFHQIASAEASIESRVDGADPLLGCSFCDVRLYRPRFLGHRIEPYAAMAAV